LSLHTHATVYPPLRIAFLVWGLAAALYFIAFFHRVTPAVITRELMAEFSLGAAALGNLSAFYFYSYVGLQIPFGMLLDRWGARRVLTTGCLVAGLGAAAFALSSSYALAAAGRLLVGAAVGVAFVAMLKLAAHWFAPSRFAMLSGLALLTGILGAISAGAPLRLATDLFGWRPAILVVALVSLLLAVVIWRVVRDDPAERGLLSHATPSPPARHPSAQPGALAGLKAVAGYRNIWLIFFLGGGFTGPMLTFAGLWGVPFLTMQYGLSTAQAALVTSAMMLAWGLAGPLLGALSDRIGRRKPVYAAGMLLATLAWSVVWMVPGLPLALLIALLMLAGIATGSVIISFAFAKESTPAHLSGTTGGVINMGNMMGGLMMQPAVGWVLDRMWDGELAAGVPVYDFAAYRAGFSLMLVWLLAGMVLLALTRETHCRQQG
jgi:MFS family permease